MEAPRTSSIARALSAACGALASGVFAGLVTGALYGLRAAPGLRWALGWRLAGLLSLPGLAVGVGLAAVALWASPDRRARGAAWVADRAPLAAALGVVAPPAAIVWLGVIVRLGRHFLTAYHHVGLATMAQGAAFLVVTLAVLVSSAWVVAALSRRLSPRGVGGVARAWGVGLLLAAATFAHGVFWGDAQGASNARSLFLGGFGVLKKPELDLTPVAMLAVIALLAALLTAVLARVGFAALPASLALMGLTLRAESTRFEQSPAAAEIDARPGLARVALRALRRRYDRDRDGFASRFGGGDCDDRDAARNPGATDVPGNGVDEDCSGRDAPLARPRATSQPSTPTVAARAWPRDMNLVLITVDTLRWDMHYAGNPHELSPNLDALAREAVVFDHGYALSSYTGRAIGPMMTGRYPTECPRDSEHFTRYLPANVFLAERLKGQGFRTFGAASHFYFETRFGLAQGVDTWDLSAMPHGEQETVAADDRVADRAIAMLRDPENTRGRFFLWVHFFDPHKQYVDHPGLPLFGRNEHARYEREVMWTDQQVGRVLDALRGLGGGVYDRTVVAVTADHGEAFGEHGMSWHGIELWEELVRVPWLLRVPGVAARHDAVARSQIDLAPTLLSLLDVPAPDTTAPDAFSGESLVPDLVGDPPPERPIYIELPEGPFNSMRRSVISDGWKLTERGARHFELYHLTDDPGERADLAATRPADLARMRALMEQVRGGLRQAPALPRRE